MRLYLRVFIWTGGPFGILIGLFYALMTNSLKGLLLGLYAGTAFGLFMSLILVTLHYLFSAKYRTIKGIDIGSVVQQKFMELDLSFDQAYDRCLQSINAIRKCKIESEDRSDGLINAKTSSSLKCFGENIEYRIWNSKNGITRVKIMSRPRLKTTLVDYSKNLDNIEKISSFLALN